MARRGENIYFRKDGRWEGRYIKSRDLNGKARFGSVYGKHYQEVKKKLVIIKSELYQSDFIPVIHGNGSFEDWADYWLEILVSPYVKPETCAGYRRSLNKHIYPALGRMNIHEIEPRHIQDMVLALQKKLAVTTLRGICRLLKSIFNAACEKGVLFHNPYQDIRVPKAGKRPPRVLTCLEQEKLERNALTNNELEYLMCLYTGIRVGELCALRWQDVDLENSILHIRHSIQRIPSDSGLRRTQLVLGTPKSESSVRDIPIPEFLGMLLREKRILEKTDAKDQLFKGVKGGYLDPRTMQQRISKLGKQLGISGVHMHTLRHTFATRCLEQGIPYEILCEFLGHSSPQITLRHYAHCTPETKRKNMEFLNSIFLL